MADNGLDKLGDMTHKLYDMYRASGIALAVSLATVAMGELWWFYKFGGAARTSMGCCQEAIWWAAMVTALAIVVMSFLLQYLNYHGRKWQARSMWDRYFAWMQLTKLLGLEKNIGQAIYELKIMWESDWAKEYALEPWNADPKEINKNDYLALRDSFSRGIARVVEEKVKKANRSLGWADKAVFVLAICSVANALAVILYILKWWPSSS